MEQAPRKPTKRLRKLQSDTARTSHQGEALESQTPKRSLGTLLLSVCLALPLVVLALIDLCISSPVEPEAFYLPEPPEFVGPLTRNNLLASAEKLYHGQVRGPESMAIRDGHIYSGTMDGSIIDIHRNHLKTLIATLGTLPCGRLRDEPTCGRPLGMRFDHHGSLFVLDAYLGLHKVNISSGYTENLFPADIHIGGKISRLFNDVAIASDGAIYLTDSSTVWNRAQNPLYFAENKPDGRLIKYDPRDASLTVLAYDIAFANGLQLSPKEDFILITESARARVMRYHLRGSKAGSMDVFSENLPGLPDNIRSSTSGGYWVGVATVRESGRLNIYDFLASKPWLRKFLMKLLTPKTYVKILSIPYGLVLELDQSGCIIRSFHDPTGHTIQAVSEVQEYDGALYLGSYNAPYLAKLTL